MEGGINTKLYNALPYKVKEFLVNNANDLKVFKVKDIKKLQWLA